MSSQLKLLVKSYYDIQLNRNILNSRLKLKKDGMPMANVEESSDYAREGKSHVCLSEIRDQFAKMEDVLEKEILTELKQMRIYNEFLKDVKGVGTFMAAILLSEFNIEIASTVSKFYAFAGICKGLVQGKKWDSKKKDFVITDNLIERDKLSAGYTSPFNKYLRTKLLGVLAGSFLKSKSPYSIFYYNYKNRKEQEFKDNKEYSKMRIHRMANRYMIKMFLSDFWLKWREIENLPIRCSYAEEYLHKKHVV